MGRNEDFIKNRKAYYESQGKEPDIEHCARCGEKLKDKKIVWFELIEGTYKFYFNGVPEGEKSQGWYPFGRTCAKKINRCD